MQNDYVSCNLCGQNNCRLLFITDEYNCNVVQCQECGLIYLNPRNVKSELLKAVSGDFYVQHYVPHSFDAHQNYQRHEKFLRKLRGYKKNGYFLDVGCASGLLLAAAREDGFAVNGVEISERAVKYGRSELGLDIWCGELKDADYPDDYFDVITCLDTIEHVQNPLVLLKEMNRILRPGGLIVLSTPNFNGLTRLFLKGSWPSIIPEHLYYFTPKTVRQMLKKGSFSVLKLSMVDIDPYSILLCGILRRHRKHSKLAEARTSLKNTFSSKKYLSCMRSGINKILSLVNLGDSMVIYAEKPLLNSPIS